MKTISKKQENKVVDFKDLAVGFKITGLNEVKRTVNLTIVFEYGEEEVKRNLRGVSISPLLHWKIKNQKEDYELGKMYKSLNTSEDWKENPFQLIRYRDEEKRDKLLLACVNERNSLKKEYEGIFGEMIIEYINRFHNSKHYKRYRSYLIER